LVYLKRNIHVEAIEMRIANGLKFAVSALVLLAMALTVQPAGSESQTLPFGLKIWYPDNWHKASGPDRFIVRSPDGSIMATFVVFEAGDTATAQKMAYEELSRIFDRWTVVTEPANVKINKLDGIVLDGTGVIGMVSVMWLARTVVYNKKALMTLGCVETSHFSAGSDTVRKIVSSVKK